MFEWHDFLIFFKAKRNSSYCSWRPGLYGTSSLSRFHSRKTNELYFISLLFSKFRSVIDCDWFDYDKLWHFSSMYHTRPSNKFLLRRFLLSIFFLALPGKIRFFFHLEFMPMKLLIVFLLNYLCSNKLKLQQSILLHASDIFLCKVSLVSM